MTTPTQQQTYTQLEAVKKRVWNYFTPDFGCGLTVQQLQQIAAGTIVPDAKTLDCMTRRMQLVEFSAVNSGLDLIRQALKQRNSRAGGLNGVKDELKVSFAVLYEFMGGNDTALSPVQLNQVAKSLWGGAAEYSAEGDLRSANKTEPQSLGVTPDHVAVNVPEAIVGRVHGQIYGPPAAFTPAKPLVAPAGHRPTWLSWWRDNG